MKQSNRHYRTLRLILGDQLNHAHSWFDKADADVVYVIAELRQEAIYVRHHVQKLCAFFAAMAAFAESLEERGHNVIYLTLIDNKYKDLNELIKVITADSAVREFEFQSPDEYRLRQQLRELDLPASITVTECDSEHFLLARGELGDYIAASKHNRMETFYRKMLHPLDVMQAALEKYETSSGAVSLAQIEGFIRQILGWCEYVRAVYWVNMPAYAEFNELQAERSLPAFFWDGQTRMNCMRHAIGQSLDHAYAHHIQRLMITGNFCLLAGIDPTQVDAWYLGVYIDAIEWVEMPNTRGMSQFADGGLVATKPYSAGANYVNKMSDYCGECEYDYRDKTTSGGCPFSSLYWDFMVRHRDRLAANPRIGMIYRNWDRQSPAQRDATLTRAAWCLAHLDAL